MIVRVSEAEVREGREAEFMALLSALVADFPARFEGLVRHEILVDQRDERRVQYTSTWADEEALVDYAGTGWRTSPVTFPGEGELLVRPLTLRHFDVHPLL